MMPMNSFALFTTGCRYTANNVGVGDEIELRLRIERSLPVDPSCGRSRADCFRAQPER